MIGLETIERAIFGIFIIIILILLLLLKPLQKYIEFLSAHLTCHEPYREESSGTYGETFLERSWLLFWTYAVFIWILAGSLYLTQIGLVNMKGPFEWYVYVVAAGLIAFIARVINTTSFVHQDHRTIAPEFFNHVFGLAVIGSLISFINLFTIWVTDPKEIIKLLNAPITPPPFTILDLFIVSVLIFGYPIFLAVVAEETINIFCKLSKRERIYTNKIRTISE